jgi:hypothetical protein
MLAVSHHVSLPRIVVGGSFACAVVLTIASSLAQLSLGLSEIVLAPPAKILAASASDFLGQLFTLPGARVGTYLVITAAASHSDVMAKETGSILSPPLSKLSTPGDCAFLPSRSPHRTFQAIDAGSVSVASPFIVSNAGGCSVDWYILCFVMIALYLGQNKNQKQDGGSLILRFGQRSSSFFKIKRLCKHFETLKHNSLFVVSVAYFSLVLRCLRSCSLLQKLKRNQNWMAHVLFWSVVSSLSLFVRGTQIVSDHKLFLGCCNCLNAIFAATLLRCSERRDSEMLGGKQQRPGDNPVYCFFCMRRSIADLRCVFV